MKIIRFVLMLLAALSIFLFVSFFNIKMLFSSSDMAKKLLNESNIYPVVAAGIRDNIVKYAQVSIGQESLIEVVNNAITENDLKLFVEDFTDQFYKVVNKQTDEKKLTLHFGWLKEKVNSEINKNTELSQTVDMDNVLSDKEIDLSSNPFVSLLIHVNDYLIGFGTAVIVFLLLLLLSGTWSQKLIWLGATFIVSGVAFIGELAIYYFGISQKALENLAKETKFEDIKFLLGVQKLITSIFDYQKVYYIVVTASLIVLGILLIVIGRLIRKHDVGMEKI